MGRKIFVSYKYWDNHVKSLPGIQNTTARDYVDRIEDLFESTDHIYKGEKDGEDLSHLVEDTIWEKLKDRIYDSTLTIVLISPCMKNIWETEKEQWIPWEISYSLKETSRRNISGYPVTSSTNAMLSVVLPSVTGSYDYFFEKKHCNSCTCTSYKTGKLFSVLKNNMFNRIKNMNNNICSNGNTVWNGEHSYIKTVKWDFFIANYETCIAKAYDIRAHSDDYKIQKEF